MWKKDTKFQKFGEIDIMRVNVSKFGRIAKIIGMRGNPSHSRIRNPTH
jgi:hypothetical protein